MAGGAWTPSSRRLVEIFAAVTKIHPDTAHPAAAKREVKVGHFSGRTIQKDAAGTLSSLHDASWIYEYAHQIPTG